MRILLATDGSAGADTARALVDAVHWPAGSTVRVVSAIDPLEAVFGAPWAPAVAANLDQLEADRVAAAEQTLEQAVRGLAHVYGTVERKVVRGRPGWAVVEEARHFAADVIVVGTRGHGAIASMLLGSVSAEVTDHAPCPVLVARLPHLTRVVLADDGSDFARAAEQVLTSWPIFGQVAIETVSVAHLASPWTSGLAPTVFAEAVGDYGRTAATLIRDYTEIAESAARRLRQAGLRASALAAQGDPAATIISIAEKSQAELIVLGTHGRTGLRRVLLGSVARNVMLHAHCSVLVVRRPGVAHPATPTPGSAPEG